VSQGGVEVEQVGWQAQRVGRIQLPLLLVRSLPFEQRFNRGEQKRRMLGLLGRGA